jgi:hypothetical protein
MPLDLEESFGLFDEIRPSGLSLRTLFHELFRGAGGLASSRVFRDPDLGLPKLSPLGRP